MASLVYLAAVVLALLIQSSPLLFAVGPGLRVDLTLVVLVYASLFWQAERALVAGFVTGLCQDALSSDVLGLNAFSKSLTAFVVHALSRHVEAQSLLAQALFASLAVAVDTGTRLVLLSVFQLPMLAFPLMVSTFVQQTVLSMCVAPCVCYGLQRAMRVCHARQDKG